MAAAAHAKVLACGAIPGQSGGNRMVAAAVVHSAALGLSRRVGRHRLGSAALTTSALPVELRIPRVSVFCPIKLRLYELVELQGAGPNDGVIGTVEDHRLPAGRGCASPRARATCARELRGKGLRSRA